MNFVIGGFVFAFLVVGAFGSMHHVQKSRLSEDLLTGYKPKIEPCDPNLKFSFDLRCARLSSHGHIVLTNVWEAYSWTDSRLKWNPEEYDNLTFLVLPHESIWTPDFKLYNEMDEVEDRDETNVRVLSDGTVQWFPTAVYRTLFHKGANNTISVHYKIGSWSLDSETLPVAKWGAGVNMQYYLANVCPLAATVGEVVIQTGSYSNFEKTFSTLHAEVFYKPHDDDDDDHHHHHAHEHKHEHDHDHSTTVAP